MLITSNVNAMLINSTNVNFSIRFFTEDTHSKKLNKTVLENSSFLYWINETVLKDQQICELRIL